MNNGWVKLHRKLRNWEWYQDSQVVHLFLHLLLLANHQEKTWQGQPVKSGQLITGRKSLSADTGISEQSIRTALVKLVRSRVISIKSTSKFSIITILKWASYQVEEENQPANQPAINQQLTTNKNVKNVKKKEYNTISAKADDIFSSKKEIDKLLTSKRKDLNIIGVYYSYLGTKFENHDQFNAQLQRNLRGAGKLKGYSLERIKATMIHLDKITDNGNKFKWTLETILKYINE